MSEHEGREAACHDWRTAAPRSGSRVSDGEAAGGTPGVAPPAVIGPTGRKKRPLEAERGAKR